MYFTSQFYFTSNTGMNSIGDSHFQVCYITVLPDKIRAKTIAFSALEKLHSVSPWSQIRCVLLGGPADLSEFLDFRSGT